MQSPSYRRHRVAFARAMNLFPGEHPGDAGPSDYERTRRREESNALEEPSRQLNTKAYVRLKYLVPTMQRLVDGLKSYTLEKEHEKMYLLNLLAEKVAK